MTESSISYRAHPLAPGWYFDCPLGNGLLSDKACGALYKDKSKQGRERHPMCVRCPVGAIHAGEADRLQSRFFKSNLCVRCFRPCARKLRGALCPSCYNRERELIAGKNARGKYPVLARPLKKERLGCVIGGNAVVRQFDRVTSRVEAMLMVLGKEEGVVAFFWASRSLP